MIWSSPPPACSEVLRFVDLGTVVCADGANGLTSVDSDAAAKRGIYVAPGQQRVPLVAYHPADNPPRNQWLPLGRPPVGLDDPANLTGPRILQGPGDPAQGAYLSMTALQDVRYQEHDARRYFDSAALPGWVLPAHELDPYGVELGDLAAVSYQGRTVWCQAYDRGPAGERLEVSVEACRELRIPDCARNGGTSAGVSIAILPGSRRFTGGRPRPWTRADAKTIAAQAAKILGAARVP